VTARATPAAWRTVNVQPRTVGRWRAEKLPTTSVNATLSSTLPISEYAGATIPMIAGGTGAAWRTTYAQRMPRERWTPEIWLTTFANARAV
ncbi:unnamed protein product, partial [Laminaria digitata]